MTISEQISQDLKAAMKAKDKETLKVVRMLKAALQKEQLEQTEPLTQEQELTIIAREMKQRKDSLVEFEKAQRDDLVQPLLAEIKIVERYLPKQLSDEEVKQVVQSIVDELSKTGAVEFGQVMPQAMAQLKGKADGKVVNQIVREVLS